MTSIRTFLLIGPDSEKARRGARHPWKECRPIRFFRGRRPSINNGGLLDDCRELRLRPRLIPRLALDSVRRESVHAELLSNEGPLRGDLDLKVVHRPSAAPKVPTVPVKKPCVQVREKNRRQSQVIRNLAGGRAGDGDAKERRDLAQFHRQALPAVDGNPHRHQDPVDVIAEEAVAGIAEEVEQLGRDGAVRRPREVVDQHIRQVGDVDGADFLPAGAVGEAAGLPEEGDADDLRPRPFSLQLRHPLLHFRRVVGHEGRNRFAGDLQNPEIL